MSGAASKRRASGASRAPTGDKAFTALSPAYETRHLKVAYGFMFHKLECTKTTPQDFLNKNLKLSADLEKISDNEYVNHLQGVRYIIEETNAKQQFIKWLQTPEVHVIYNGHARYGRGPCFGAGRGIQVDCKTEVPSEDWEEGSDANSGIFRMGYPYVGVDVDELITHGYTANPVKTTEGVPSRANCDPELRGHLSGLHALAPEHIKSNGHPIDPDKLRNHTDGDRYWTYRSRSDGLCLIHHAGWQKTLSAPSDFGSLHDPDAPDTSKLQCRVLTHLGCSTFIHNYPVVRKIAKWQQEGNERYAFWTTALAAEDALGPWLNALISYKKWNAFESWSPSLAWAVDRVNVYLRPRDTYRLV